MKKLFLPTLHTFENNNIFTGSLGTFRYRVEPIIVMLSPKEVNLSESTMKAEYWHGPLCYEKSTMEGKRIFPLSEEGKSAMCQWLTDAI